MTHRRASRPGWAAALAAAAALVGVSLVPGTATAARACPPPRSLVAYLRAMDDDARVPLQQVLAARAALARVPAARTTATQARWAAAASAVRVAAQAVDHYAEEVATVPAPASLRAPHRQLTGTLLDAFRSAARLPAALDVGDAKAVREAQPVWAAAAGQLAAWKRAVTAAAAAGGAKLPAWMRAPGSRAPRACG